MLFRSARGFVAHHITDIWGFTSPGDLPRSGLWPTGAAWLTQHLWEHYLFAPDRAFLARAYPIMKESAEFFLDYLVEDPRGRLVSGPSVSPENRYRLPNGNVGILCMGPSMDSQIVRGLFTQTIEAGRILILRDHVIVDPGIGFGKTFDDNYRLLGGLFHFQDLAAGVLAGPSRKGFTGEFSRLPADQRQFPTAAAVAIAVLHGADVIRVHDVCEMKQVVNIIDRFRAIQDTAQREIPNS